MTTGRPGAGEYAPFYAGYVERVPEDDILEVLAGQRAVIGALADAVPPGREDHRYAEGKWSVKQVLSHLIDAERVFGYRAFCLSRGEQTPLPGFDENDYVSEAALSDVSLAALAAEFVAVRDANLAFLRRLAAPAWTRTGTASGKPVSVRALAFIMAGHPRHHLAVLRERYGVGA